MMDLDCLILAGDGLIKDHGFKAHLMDDDL